MQFQLVRLPEVVDLAQVMMQKAFQSLAPKKRKNRSYLSSLAEVMQWQALGPVCTETKEDGDASGAANQSASLIGLDVWKREPNKGTVQLKSLARVALHGWRETACRPTNQSAPYTPLSFHFSKNILPNYHLV